METELPTTMEKALAINLDPLKYGTIVEIGAGQEVARWFFQAGAAAGSIAKTMSAYDMNFSDEIYGTSADKRYVSRGRLERMLEKEFSLIISRVKESRPEGSTFFSFANTVTAQGFNTRGECHGWMGVHLQLSPHAEPDDVIIHVRMLDDTNLEQQDALGILGVNLIYGAFHYAYKPEQLMRSLLDNLKWGRVEIDLVEFRGPTLGSVDNSLMALELVKASLTPAVLFNPSGQVVIPAEALYKKSVLGVRGDFNPVTSFDTEMFKHAKANFAAQPDVAEGSILCLAEITMAVTDDKEAIDTADFLSRVKVLSALGFHVLISEFFRYFRVRQYLAAHTPNPFAIVTSTVGFEKIMREDYYYGLDGGMLEGLGKLFTENATMYVCPGIEDGNLITLDKMPVVDHLLPLITYLRERGKIIPDDSFDPTALDNSTPSSVSG
ncbi:MAG: TonB-dependent receptor [Alphaproteobacteria bacterium]|nr:TonB-dependent receptor [Alphaproteobacteria bacterium]